MATRQERLAEFTSSGEPPAQTCEILGEDHNDELSASTVPFSARYQKLTSTWPLKAVSEAWRPYWPA